MMKNLLFRSYVVVLLVSLAVPLELFPFKALGVQSMPLAFFIFLAGGAFPLCYFRQILRFIRDRRLILLFAGLFLLSGIFSAALSPFPTIKGLKTLVYYGTLFGISFLLLFLFYLDEGLSLFFLKAVAGIAIALAVLAICEVAHEGLYRFLSRTFRYGAREVIDGRPRVSGTLAHPNVFGCFMSVGVLLLLYLKGIRRVKAGIFYPAAGLLSIAMALSASRNAAFVLMVPLFFLLFNRKTAKTAIIVLAMALLATGVLTPSGSRFADLLKLPAEKENRDVAGEAATPRQPDRSEPRQPDRSVEGPANTAVSRLFLWQSALAMFRDHPLFGIGPGAYNRALKDYASGHLHALEKGKIDKGYLNAHNGFFNILAEFGTAGAAVALTFASYLVFVLVRRYGFFPPGPVHALLLGIALSFGPDAFFHSMFYMVLTLNLFFSLAFPGNAPCCLRGSPAPADEAVPQEKG